MTLAPLEINSTVMLETKVVCHSYVGNKSGMQPDFHLFLAYICSFFSIIT